MKTLIKSALLLLLVMTLTGCVGAPKTWVKPEANLSQVKMDIAACELYAETGIAPTDTSNKNQKVWNTNCRNGDYGSTDCTTTQGHQNKTAAESFGEGFGAGLARGMKRNKIEKLCMQSKGYYKEDELSIRQEDMDAWIGRPAADIGSDPTFSGSPITKTVAADGIEIWTIKRRAKLPGSGCKNIFYIKDGIVLRYSAEGYGVGWCLRPNVNMKSTLEKL